MSDEKASQHQIDYLASLTGIDRKLISLLNWNKNFMSIKISRALSSNEQIKTSAINSVKKETDVIVNARRKRDQTPLEVSSAELQIIEEEKGDLEKKYFIALGPWKNWEHTIQNPPFGEALYSPAFFLGYVFLQLIEEVRLNQAI